MLLPQPSTVTVSRGNVGTDMSSDRSSAYPSPPNSAAASSDRSTPALPSSNSTVNRHVRAMRTVPLPQLATSSASPFGSSASPVSGRSRRPQRTATRGVHYRESTMLDEDTRDRSFASTSSSKKRTRTPDSIAHQHRGGCDGQLMPPETPAQTVNGVAERPACDDCKKTFDRKEEYRRHRKTCKSCPGVTGEIWYCGGTGEIGHCEQLLSANTFDFSRQSTRRESVSRGWLWRRFWTAGCAAKAS